MAQLLVFGVDSPQTAEKVFDLAGELTRQELLELADAAWVERTADGKVKLHQSVNLTAAGASYGAASGALWGTLIGLLFLNPLAGACVPRTSRWTCARRHWTGWPTTATSPSSAPGPCVERSNESWTTSSHACSSVATSTPGTRSPSTCETANFTFWPRPQPDPKAPRLTARNSRRHRQRTVTVSGRARSSSPAPTRAERRDPPVLCGSPGRKGLTARGADSTPRR